MTDNEGEFRPTFWSIVPATAPFPKVVLHRKNVQVAQVESSLVRNSGMTTEQNKEILRRFFELRNSGDVKTAVAMWATESFNHGRKVDHKMMESVFESLNLLQEHQSIHEMVAEGDWVAFRTTCEGVHAAKVRVNGGIFAEIQPTGRKYTVQHMHLFRIVDGKIKEHWANRDDLGAARQVGLELRPTSNDPALH